MERLTIHSPVPPSDVLALAGAGTRRAGRLLLQALRADAVSIRIDGAPVALAMLYRESPRVRELCVAFAPSAGRHMRRLLRLAQLTLPALRQDGGVIVARIRTDNAAGWRMARLAGFRPAGAEGERLWVFDERNCEGPVRRRQRQRDTGGRTGARPSGRCQ